MENKKAAAKSISEITGIAEEVILEKIDASGVQLFLSTYHEEFSEEQNKLLKKMNELLSFASK